MQLIYIHLKSNYSNPINVNILPMIHDAIFLNINLLKLLLLLGIYFISRCFINLRQLVLLLRNLLNYHVYGMQSVTKSFYVLRKCRLYHRFQLNITLIHKLLEPILHDLQSHHDANVWQFPSIYYFYFERLQPFF